MIERINNNYNNTTTMTSYQFSIDKNESHDRVLSYIYDIRDTNKLEEDIDEWFIPSTFVNDNNKIEFMFDLSDKGLYALDYFYYRKKDLLLKFPFIKNFINFTK